MHHLKGMFGYDNGLQQIDFLANLITNAKPFFNIAMPMTTTTLSSISGSTATNQDPDMVTSTNKNVQTNSGTFSPLVIHEIFDFPKIVIELL